MIWNCAGHFFDTQKPLIMGILNVTPDSFSDGGKYLDFNSAIEHAHKMVKNGALIIDVGGESSRPGAQAISLEEELRRTIDVVQQLSSEGLYVSIDTRKPKVAEAAIEAGAVIINDITGFRNPDMVKVAQNNNVGIIVMHMKGNDPSTMQDYCQYIDVVDEVCHYLNKRVNQLEDFGISHDRICIDPGPGFGKTPKQTIQLMRNIQEFRHLGYPMMCAISRKRYLNNLYYKNNSDMSSFEKEDISLHDRDMWSATEALKACEMGATIIRTHNVEITLETITQNLRPYVLIGAGSNVALVANPGEEIEGKKAMINKAIADLSLLPDSDIIDVAPYYESEPAYLTNQDNFVNTVILLRTGLPPHELLAYLEAIENSLGRIRTQKNGPRTIDLDILDYQGYVSESQDLILPHPRLLERDFVVSPLLDIVPNHILSNGILVTRDQINVGKAYKC